MKNDHRSRFSNLSNWKEEAWSLDFFSALIFFQASSFQLLKLENLLRWSFFTLNCDSLGIRFGSRDYSPSNFNLTEFFFMTHYFVSSYCCCTLVLWYTFSIHLFSCVISSFHMTMIFNFISHYVRIVYLFSTSLTCAWV